MNLTTDQLTAALDARLADPEAAAKIGDKAAQDAVRAQFHDRLNSLSGTELGTMLASKGFKIEGINDQPTAPSISRDDLDLTGLDTNALDDAYEQAMSTPLPAAADVPVSEYPPKPPTSPRHAAPAGLDEARRIVAELEAQSVRDEAAELAARDAVIAADVEDEDRAERAAFVEAARADLVAEASAARDRAGADCGDWPELDHTSGEDCEACTVDDYDGVFAHDEAVCDTDAETFPERLARIAAETYTEAAETLPVNDPFDPVKRPEHYNSHPSGVECNTIARYYSFNIGSAIKYLWRHGLKSNAPAAQDIRKAIQFLEFELDKIENTEAAA